MTKLLTRLNENARAPLKPSDLDEAPFGRKKDGTPRKPNAVQRRNLSGLGASGIPAMGAGWGGPAKGAKRKTFCKSDPDIAQLMRKRDPDAYAELIANKDALRLKMAGVIVEVALNSENDVARVSAADKVLDRLDGKPGQTVKYEGAPIELAAGELMVDSAMLTPENREALRGILLTAIREREAISGPVDEDG